MLEARLALYQTAMLPMYFSDGVDSFSKNQGEASDTVQEVESTFCFIWIYHLERYMSSHAPPPDVRNASFVHLGDPAKMLELLSHWSQRTRTMPLRAPDKSFRL